MSLLEAQVMILFMVMVATTLSKVVKGMMSLRAAREMTHYRMVQERVRLMVVLEMIRTLETLVKQRNHILGYRILIYQMKYWFHRTIPILKVSLFEMLRM